MPYFKLVCFGQTSRIWVQDAPSPSPKKSLREPYKCKASGLRQDWNRDQPSPKAGQQTTLSGSLKSRSVQSTTNICKRAKTFTLLGKTNHNSFL